MNDEADKGGRRSLRWLKWGSGIVLLLVLVAGGVLYALSSRYVSANFIAAEIEKQNNCRVQIGSVKWNFPSTIVVKDLQIAVRDSMADGQVPHDDREPLAGPGAIRIGSGSIEADAGGILSGNLRLREILLDDVVVESTIDEDGKFSLEELFDDPAEVGIGTGEQEKGKDDSGGNAATAKKESEEEKSNGDKEEDGGGDLAIPPTLDLFRLKNGTFIAHTEETDSIIELTNLNIEMRDFDIDPASLSEHRSANVHIDTVMKILSDDRSFEWAEFDLETDGDAFLLDEEGEFNPDLQYTFVVKKGSRIADLPTLGKLGEKIESLQNVGIRLRSLGRKLEFDEDASMVMLLRQGDLSLLEPADILFSGHRLTLDEGSHVQTGTNDHRFEGQLLLSEALSTEVFEESVKFLADTVGFGEDNVRPLLELTMKPAMKEGRVWLPFVSKEDLSSPKVDLRVKLKNPLESLEEDSGKAAIKLLEGLFKK